MATPNREKPKNNYNNLAPNPLNFAHIISNLLTLTVASYNYLWLTFQY